MKLGIDGQYIDANDIQGLPWYLDATIDVGDLIYNPQGELLYYHGHNQFSLSSNQAGAYLANPDGPWYSLSHTSLSLTDSRPPMQKIKEWLSSNF